MELLIYIFKWREIYGEKLKKFKTNISGATMRLHEYIQNKRGERVFYELPNEN